MIHGGKAEHSMRVVIIKSPVFVLRCLSVCRCRLLPFQEQSRPLNLIVLFDIEARTKEQMFSEFSGVSRNECFVVIDKGDEILFRDFY